MNTQHRKIEISIDGQRFRVVGSVAVSPSGSTGAVLTARCAYCGEPFTQVATPAALGKGDLSRRCSTHRRPGAKVGVLHPAALLDPPFASLGAGNGTSQVHSPAASARTSRLDEIVLRSRGGPAITARRFLLEIGEEWPGYKALVRRLAISNNGVQKLIARAIELGLIKRIGKNTGASYVLTALARAEIAAESASPKSH